MRVRSILSEAFRNLVSGTTRAGWLAAAVALAATATAVVDVGAITDIQRRAALFDASGASVRVVAAERQVAAASCEAVSRLSGITAAGAWRARRPVTLRAVAGNAVPAFEATPGLAAVLGVRGADRGDDGGGSALGPGVWLPADLAQRFGVSVGGTLPTTEGPMRVAGTYVSPDDGRDTRFGYAVIVPVPVAGLFDSCWVHIWPATNQVDALLTTATDVAGENAQPVSLGRLNNNFGDRLDAYGDLVSRPTRLMALGGALAAFLIAGTATLRRRLEHASALHAGVPRSAQVGIVAVETVIWSTASLAVAAAAVVLLSWRTAPSEPLVVAMHELHWLALIPAAAVLGAMAALLTVRERHLFGYFKDR